jgi:hypothetical protein
MFNLSTQNVVPSIEKTPINRKGPFVYQHYHNFFTNIQDLMVDIDGNQFETLEKQEKYPRKKLRYDNTQSKRLKVFFMDKNITQALQEKFSTSLKFSSVDYWSDQAGYFLPSHVDHDSIKLSLQIYIGEDHPGTVLFDNNTVVHTFKFENNSGYAMLSNNKTFHGLEYPVKRNNRFSIYVRYQ